ncbi:MAG: DUF5320 domain-containing protein [Fibrobacter sp.]|nr:DUF5320 domain-containing protein [Fibrobacter sp.]
MPARDGTGPFGSGFIKGKGNGFCAVYNSQYEGTSCSRGQGCRRSGGGAGFKWRNGRSPYASPQQDEITGLKVQARQLESSLESIRSRLDKLNG